MHLGKCPYCEGNVVTQKITVQGRAIQLYTCENATKEYDMSDTLVFKTDATCRFRVYSNALLRWNKRSLSEKEMQKLLREGRIIVRLHGRKGTKEYFKYAVTDEEYGLSVLWDEEVSTHPY